MRIVYVGLVLATVTLCGCGGYNSPTKSSKEAVKDPAAIELDKLQGAWQVIRVELAGKVAPSEKIKDLKMVFQGDKITVSHGDTKETVAFKLDPAKNPKHIDMEKGTDSKKVTLPGQGIYELDGDNLKIAGEIGDNKKRPTQFDSADKLMVLYLQREKK